MKKIIFILSLFVASIASAQVAIEKTALRSQSSILEFGDVVTNPSNTKGIILPVIDNLDSATQQGTIYVDATGGSTSGKVVYRSASKVVALTPTNTNIVASTIADTSEGTVIRDGSIAFADDQAPAVLKLSSNNKALILPHVNTTDEVVNPEVGTMVYDKSSKSLAIYNGEVWSFWKK